jgi:predicted Rossmann fold flavoprotein
MERYSTAVIGGGAAGICAAISSARHGESVIICEKTAQIGKKILATGNGKCNLLNDDLDESYYNPEARPLVKSILRQFGKPEIINLFKELGLGVYSGDDGRVFPVTNQASSVLKVLEIELKRLAVPVEFDFDCAAISLDKGGIQLSSRSGKKVQCNKAIVAGGGKTYPVYGADGTLYPVVRRLGHSIVEPVPVGVPLVVKDPLCQALQGQKINAVARGVINGRESNPVKGELLFTKYGLSGTCILDISAAISIALNREHQKDVWAVLDLVPFMPEDQLKSEIARRLKTGWKSENLLAGILPNKFGPLLKPLLAKKDVGAAVNRLKGWRFKIDATLGWNEAEFTAGGVDVAEVDTNTLESKIKKRIYFAGEILDVDGKRGGYNLAWAWASGFVAGQTR